MRWRLNALLFLLTVLSVFGTGLLLEDGSLKTRAPWIHSAQFTGALLGILVVHEFGHYVATRIHKVEASLPYFIPLPGLGFGTMGAVIRMRGRIPTRKALLDIGASGPLAGLAVAIPLYAWGVAHSHLVASSGVTSGELGESLLMRLLDHLFAGPQPAGQELLLHPVAFGAWAGMLVTMLNLLPVSQLDGGHVAYALFGPRQDRFAVTIHRAVLAFFFVSFAGYTMRDLRAGLGFVHLGHNVGNSLFWLAWFEILAVLGTLSTRAQLPPGERDEPEPGTLTIRTRAIALVLLIGFAAFMEDSPRVLPWVAWFVGLGLLIAMEVRGGVLRRHSLLDHPPTGSAKLDPVRAGVAIFSLVMFVLLFMPTPIQM